MDSENESGLIVWVKRNPSLPIAALLLALLLVVVWRQGGLVPPTAPLQPAAQAHTPVAASATSPQAAATAGRWVALPGLLDGKINTLLVTELDSVRVLYAGTDGGVFKSVDQGRTWVSCNDGLADRLVRSLALDPDDGRTLYAGTWNGRVHISRDGGSSWSDRSTGLPPMQVVGLAVHTHNPRKVYAASSAGVFTTTNGGEHWYPTARITGTVQCMAMEPEEPDTLYVGTHHNGVFKTLDGGLSWFRLRGDLPNVSSLVIAPRTLGTLYAIADGEVWKTETLGFAWGFVDYWRDPSVAQSLAVNPDNPQQVFVGLSEGLHRSEDGRQSWAPSQAGLEAADVHVVVVDPMEPSVVYACSGNQLFASGNSGRSWERRGGIKAHNDARILALEADPFDGDAFYASADGAGLFRTTDRGQQWEHVGEGIRLASLTALDVDPMDGEVVYAGSREGIVFRSTAGATGWAFGHRVAEAPISALVIDPQQPSRIYAGTEGQGLYRSDDQGTTWSSVGTDIGRHIQQIVIDSRGPGIKLYAATEAGVFRSLDAGASWEPYLSPVGAIAPPLAGTHHLVAVTRTEPGLVSGQGVGDTILVPQDTIATGARVETVTTHAAQPGTLYAMVQGVGIAQSTDFGVTWTALGTGLDTHHLLALALSADDPSLILAGTDRGVYQYQPGNPSGSRDSQSAGALWESRHTPHTATG
jgi:photosystem II stability/assembly factor-like uncharacterized protein